MATSLLPPAGGQLDLVQLGTIEGGEPIVLTQEALCSGCYLLGVQGTGKTSLLEQIAAEQMRRPESLVVLDAHGQLNRNLIARAGQQLIDQGKVLHLDIRDEEHPFPFNPFRCKDPTNRKERRAVRDGVLRALAKLWPEVESQVYFKDMLYLVVSLLIVCSELTLKNVKRLLADAAYRAPYVQRLAGDDEEAAEAWDEYERLRAYEQERRRKPFLTRVDELLRDDVIRASLCHPGGKIDFRQAIEQREIVLITLPVNEPGYQHAAKVIGTFLLSAIYETTFSFVDVPEDKRPGFTLIVDEFQNFATSDYAILFSQGRQYAVKQILAHQYRSQLDEMGGKLVKDGTLTAHTRVIFRVNDTDALELSRKFSGLYRRPQIILTNPTAQRGFREHRSQVIREFSRDVVQELEDAVRMRIDSLSGTDYWGNRVKRELLPQREFPLAGTVPFHPKDAEAALSALNKALYQSQTQTRVDEDALQQFMHAYGQLTGTGCLSQEELLRERREAQSQVEELEKSWADYLEDFRARHAGLLVSARELVAQYRREEVDKLAEIKHLRGEISRELKQQRKHFWWQVCLQTYGWETDLISTYRMLHCVAGDFEHRLEGYYEGLLNDEPEKLLRPDGSFYEFVTMAEAVQRQESGWQGHGVRRQFEGFSLWQYWRCDFIAHKPRIEALLQDIQALQEAQERERKEAWQFEAREQEYTRKKQEIDKRLSEAERGQRVQAGLWQQLMPVVTALLEQPIAADESELSAPEIASLLQRLPNRQAVVAIGARVTAMDTVDLATRGDKVAAEVAKQREHRIKAATVERYQGGQRTAAPPPIPPPGQTLPETRQQEAQRLRAAQAEAEGEAEALPPDLPLPTATPTRRPTNQAVPRLTKRRRESPPPPPQGFDLKSQEWRPYDEV